MMCIQEKDKIAVRLERLVADGIKSEECCLCKE